VGNGIPLLTVCYVVLIRPYLTTTIPLDSDSGLDSDFVVEPYVVDVFVELEMPNPNQKSGSDSVVVVVAAWKIVHLGLHWLVMPSC